VLIAVTAIVPIAWLAINHSRTGHALDFVTRVADYRARTDASRAIEELAHGHWRQLTALASLAGLLVVTAAWAQREIAMRALIPVGGATGVVVLLVATEASGGGATHHPARSLLLVVWLLAPVAFTGLSRWWTRGERGARAMAVTLAGLIAAQMARGSLSVPRDVDPDTIAIGRAIGRLTPAGELFFVEASRLDFLWLELASGAPERAVPDREFGAGPTDAMGRARRCATAAVHDGVLRSGLASVGWREVGDYGPWTLMARPR
jgi:hypothetical protein